MPDTRQFTSEIFKVQSPSGKGWVEVVSVTVAAELCQVTQRTMQRALKEGNIQGHRVGRQGMDWAVPVKVVEKVQKVGWKEATGRKPGRPWEKAKRPSDRNRRKRG